jgi:hypothetical protein
MHGVCCQCSLHENAVLSTIREAAGVPFCLHDSFFAKYYFECITQETREGAQCLLVREHASALLYSHITM